MWDNAHYDLLLTEYMFRALQSNEIISPMHTICVPPVPAKHPSGGGARVVKLLLLEEKNSSVKLLELISSNWELIEIAVAIDFFMHFSCSPWQTPMKSNKYPFGFHGNFYHVSLSFPLPNFTHENPCKSAWRIWRSPNNSPWYLLWRQNTSPGIAGIAEFWKTLNIAE